MNLYRMRRGRLRGKRWDTMKLMTKLVTTMREDGKMNATTTVPVGTMNNGKMMVLAGMTSNGTVLNLWQRETLHIGWQKVGRLVICLCTGLV